MYSLFVLSLLATSQLTTALPQARKDGPVLEPPLSEAGIKAPGGQLKKIRYGPFKLPAMGMLENKLTMNMEKPCSNCFVTAYQAGLEDEAGKSVNTDVGAWLHHIVMYQTGSGEKDLVCPLYPAKRVFASGNERTPVRISTDGMYGIRIGATTRVSMLYDLVNESDKPATYYITVTYEYSPDKSIKPADLFYLDVTGNCGVASVPPKDGSYTLSNNPGYKSAISGKLLSATGHGHDGVDSVRVKVGGKVVCESQQMYGNREGYTSQPMGDMPGMAAHSSTAGHSDGHSSMAGQSGMEGMAGLMPKGLSLPKSSSPALAGGLTGMIGGLAAGQVPTLAPLKSAASVKHVSDTSICMDFGSVKVGDRVEIDALYDTKKNGLNKMMGEYAELMGISLVYVAAA